MISSDTRGTRKHWKVRTLRFWTYVLTEQSACGPSQMFFFSSRRRHTRCSRDWSSDVCSSDLLRREVGDEVDIMLDFHGRTTPAMGIQYGRAVAPYSPLFIEEPCLPENVEAIARSEERRVGKECRSRWSPYH